MQQAIGAIHREKRKVGALPEALQAVFREEAAINAVLRKTAALSSARFVELHLRVLPPDQSPIGAETGWRHTRLQKGWRDNGRRDTVFNIVFQHVPALDLAGRQNPNSGA